MYILSGVVVLLVLWWLGAQIVRQQGQGAEENPGSVLSTWANVLRLIPTLVFQVFSYPHELLFARDLGHERQKGRFFGLIASVLFPTFFQVWVFAAMARWPAINETAAEYAKARGGKIPEGEQLEALATVLSMEAPAIIFHAQAWPYYLWGVVIFGFYFWHMSKNFRGYATGDSPNDNPHALGELRHFGFDEDDWWPRFILWPAILGIAGLPFLFLGYTFGLFLIANAFVLFTIVMGLWDETKFLERLKFEHFADRDPFAPNWAQGRYRSRRQQRRRRPFRTHIVD